MNTTKLVLCGSNYAATYIRSLAKLTDIFELIGILARGSERSTRLAAVRKVPLWRSISEIPIDAQAAIVALPPAAAATVTKQLIRRGVHVLMEHPVSSDVLREIREEALLANIAHLVNCHFAELSAARLFVDECRVRRALSPARYASVVTASRSAYSTFDLLGRALGALASSDLERELTATMTTEHPFASFRGVVNGVPTRVQCSHVVGTVDDGSDSPVPQRIEIGFRDGNLVLLSFTGPVIWSEALRLGLRDYPGPLWRTLTEEPMTFPDLTRDRANANKRTLEEFHQRIWEGTEPAHQSTEWLTTVAELTTAVSTTQTKVD